MRLSRRDRPHRQRADHSHRDRGDTAAPMDALAGQGERDAIAERSAPRDRRRRAALFPAADTRRRARGRGRVTLTGPR